MIESPTFTLSVYNLSTRYGFLPDEAPLERIPDPYFRPWEDLVANLHSRITSRSFRDEARKLPVLHADLLHGEAQWRRAYVIFSFLTHAFIWGGDQPASTLPPSIAVPFLIIADHFALPATATYAGFNLWNWAPVQTGADIRIPENVRILHTFTGTDDESWFYLISVSIEAQGADVICAMLECFDAIRTKNDRMVVQCLSHIAARIRDIGTLLDRMHERCDPDVFYHQIRPFLAGSKGMEKAGLAQGVFYDEGAGQGQWRQYSGGSNAQSSLIQMLDIMLGVQHHSTGSSKLKPKTAATKAGLSYIHEMRNYMPGSHRHFLSYVSGAVNIRPYVEKEEIDPVIREAYQSAVTALTLFRDKHIRIVSRYIIIPSRQALTNASDQRMNLAIASSTPSRGVASTGLSGTGGTVLIPFLKQTRDETQDAGRLST